MNSNTRKAWQYLAVTPIALFIGIVLSEWLYSDLGYEVGTTNAPLHVKLLMLVVSFVIILILPGTSIVYSRKAKSEGDSKAKTPLILATVFIAAFVLSSLPGLFAK